MLFLLFPLAACSAGTWAKPDVSQERAAQDYSECRHLGEIAIRRDSNIDTDIIASRGGDWDRSGIGIQKRLDYADSNRARTSDIVTQCMLGKGYSTDK